MTGDCESSAALQSRCAKHRSVLYGFVIMNLSALLQVRNCLSSVCQYS